MKIKLKSKKFVCFIIVFLVIISAIVYKLHSIPTDIKIATGRISGGYYNFGLKYQKLLDNQLNIELISTAGSIAVLEKLRTGKADFGLVQGGVADKEKYANLKSIGSLFYEPIWFFIEKLKNLFTSVI
jgi:TRAP-type uncharacterized transport system substrate-binding protein